MVSLFSTTLTSSSSSASLSLTLISDGEGWWQAIHPAVRSKHTCKEVCFLPPPAHPSSLHSHPSFSCRPSKPDLLLFLPLLFPFCKNCIPSADLPEFSSIFDSHLGSLHTLAVCFACPVIPSPHLKLSQITPCQWGNIRPDPAYARPTSTIPEDPQLITTDRGGPRWGRLRNVESSTPTFPHRHRFLQFFKNCLRSDANVKQHPVILLENLKYQEKKLTADFPKFLPEPTKQKMELCTFACFPVWDWFWQISVEAFLAVVTVTASCVVPTVEADSSALSPRQFVQLHVETTPSGVKVTVAGCEGDNKVY